MASLKSLAREALPKRLQVPAKYWYSYVRGDLEPEMALLPKLVSRGDHAVDIGGNRGTYAYRLAKLGARVSVFEPNPVCIAVLAPWAARERTITVHPVALSSASGEAELAVPVDDHGVEHDASASIEHAPTSHVRRQRVELQTLDSFGIRDATLIKIDVEGHEASVIAGAVETIRATMPAMIVEIEQRHIHRPIAAVFEQIGAMGYEGYYLAGKKLISIEHFDVVSHQPAAALGSRSAPYVNNFLFLDRAGLAGGRYDALFRA